MRNECGYILPLLYFFMIINLTFTVELINQTKPVDHIIDNKKIT